MSFVIDDYIIAAGQHLPIEEMGNYFVIMDSDAAVTVTIKQNRNPIGVANNVTFGFAFGPTKTPFTDVSIYSATTQTLKLAFTDDPVLYQKLVGEVSIAGTLPAFATNPDINQIVQPVNILRQPALDISVTSYQRTSAASALNTIVTPAANVSGVEITNLALRADNSAQVRVMIKQTAPAAWSDGTVIARIIATGGSQYQSHNMAQRLKIPGGYGLYEQSDSATGTTAVDLAYEVL